MPVIEIYIPDTMNDTLEQLDRPKEEIIVTAVQNYLSQRENSKQEEETLKEGYLAGRREAKILLNEFDHIDIENWDDY